MWKFLFSFAALLSCVFTRSPSNVLVLTGKNFDQIVSENSKILVEFYAPWCGHCKALEPEYEAAAKQLKKDGSDFVLAKVDATVHEKLAERFGIQGFPTIKYFTNGNTENPAEYNGGRTSQTILEWIDIRTKPATEELKSEEEFKTFTTSGKAKLVLFVKDTEQFNAFAEENRESLGQIGIVSDPDLAGKVNAKMGTAQLFCEFKDYKPVTYEGEMTTENLTKFAKAERFPLFDAIGPDNYKDYMDRGLPLVWVSLDGSDDDMIEKITKALEEHTKAFKGELSFTWVDNVKYAQHVQNLGIKGNPGMLIMGDPDKFMYEGDFFNAEELKSFFSKYKDGTLQPHMKSQEPPTENDGNVFVLVGSEFKNVVGQDKDVMVEYYAPWCGHCKRLEPEYEKVGEAFKDVPGIVIAKVDATENDTPEQIQGFPTLIFYPKGRTKGIPYEEDRTAKAIIDFIKEKATVDTSGIKEEL